MRVEIKRALAVVAAVAVVLTGAWAAGFEWERGAGGFFVFYCVVAGSFLAAAYPFQER